MNDGDITLSTQLDTRPVLRSLSDLKRKITDAFKGGDVNGLRNELKNVTAELKKAEAEARKAQTALNATMSGEKDPQAVKQLNAELKSTESELAKVQKQFDSIVSGEKTPQSFKELEKAVLAAEKEVEQYRKAFEEVESQVGEVEDAVARFSASKEYDKAAAVVDEYNAKFREANQAYQAAQSRLASLNQELLNAQRNPESIEEAQQYKAQIEALQVKADDLKNKIASIRQNPQATAEAQRYQQVIDETSKRIEILKSRQQELGATLEETANRGKFSLRDLTSGFVHLENRLIRLAKRVFFFSVFTKALRGLRSYISSVISADDGLSQSLAQVKANLATSFGAIWLSIVPALQTLVNWLAIATRYIAQFISWLTGKSFKQSQGFMDNMNKAAAGVADNTGGIGSAAKKSAKEMQRLLLPFDEMNVLSKQDDSDGGGGGGGGGAGGGLGAATPWQNEIDGLNAKLNKFKDLIALIGSLFAAWKLSKVLAPLFGLLGTSKLAAFAGLASIIFGIYELVTSIKSLLKEGPNFANVMGIIAGAFMIIGGVVMFFNPLIGAIIIAFGALHYALKKLYENFAPFRELVDTLIAKFKEWKDALVNAFKEGGIKELGKKAKEIGKEILAGIIIGFKIIKAKIGKWIREHIFNPIVKKIKAIFGINSPAKEMQPIGEDIFGGILKGILNKIKGIGTWIKTKVFAPLKKALSNNNGILDFDITPKFPIKPAEVKKKWKKLVASVKDKTAHMKAKVATKWNNIKGKWNGIINNIEDKTADMKAKIATKWNDVKGKWHGIINNIKDKTASMKAKIGNTWGSIRSAWHSITNNIKDKTASMRAEVGSTWSSLSSTWNNLLANFNDKTVSIWLSIQGSVQDLKNWFNWSVIDSLNYRIHQLPFMKNVSIPYLAQGAVIPANKQFLAMLGDQKYGTNIETPLTTMIEAFNAALKSNGYGNGQAVNVYLQGDAKQLFRVVRTEADNYTQSTGKAAFNL